VVQLLGSAKPGGAPAAAQMVTTLGQNPPPALEKALFSFGIKEFSRIPV
jgi:hypothetical protein